MKISIIKHPSHSYLVSVEKNLKNEIEVDVGQRKDGLFERWQGLKKSEYRDGG